MRSLVAFAVAILLVSGLMAQDDRGIANDPSVNERANACFDGGSLAGKCHTTDADRNGVVDDLDVAFMWWCGWYVIRVEYRHIPPVAAPEGCTVQLPEVETPAQEATPSIPLLLMIFFDPNNPQALPSEHLDILVEVFNNGRVEVVGDMVLLYPTLISGSPIAQMLASSWDAFAAWYAQ